jgi:putative transport protein
MIALSYGITYIWGTVGIIVICKYLPRWWGVDARKAAKEYEAQHGVKDVEGGGLTGYSPFGLRAYRLENPAAAGQSIANFRRINPEYRIANLVRNGESLGASPTLVMQKGDVIALGGPTSALTDKMGLIGPEVADQNALNVPLDQADILVTHKKYIGRALETFRQEPVVGQVQLVHYERGGVPFPAGLKTTLQRMDILSVVGLKPAVEEIGAKLGRIARANAATDLLTLAVGMILGFLIGLVQFPAFGAKVGLGNAGGLLLSGVIVSSVVSRLRFFGNTPNAARNILEDLGLVVFVGIVGVNAGASLLAQLTGAIALKIFVVGFIACTIPPFIVWAIGFPSSRSIPPADGRRGGRSLIPVPAVRPPSRSGAWSVDRFPVAWALSRILLTVFVFRHDPRAVGPKRTIGERILARHRPDAKHGRNQ